VAGVKIVARRARLPYHTLARNHVKPKQGQNRFYQSTLQASYNTSWTILQPSW